MARKGWNEIGALRLSALEATLPGAGPPVWLDPGQAVDIPFAAARADLVGIRAALDGVLAGAPIDVVVQPVASRRKLLLLADMDSTMIGQECIDELADFAGLKAEVAAITERAMRGELPFAPALRERVALLRGLPVATVDEVLGRRITLMPGGRALVRTMKANGGYCALVSGGFTLFTGAVAAMIGFDEHRANTLEVEGDHLAGTVAEPILGGEAKRDRLVALRDTLKLDPAAVLAVGDGANDLAMLDEAGLGVAFKAKPAVAAAARARIDHNDLDALLFVQGLSPRGYRGVTDTDDGPEITAFSVGPEEAGQRLDKLLAQHAAREDLGLSRTRLQELIGQGFVRLDGAVASSPNAKPKEGTRILFAVPPPVDATPLPEDIPLAIVFEDEDLIVVDKPAGLVVHPAPGHASGTLVNALLHHCGEGLSGIGGIRRPGIVHRLDKDTTGLMVAAKTERAHQGLADVFADHGRSGSLVREYLAGVWTLPDRGSGTVEAPIGRHPHQRERMAVVRAAKGRHAITHWTVEDKFPPSATLMRCRLETGRTHQIRVHMAEIGHPLIGDMVYGGGFKTKASGLDDACRAAIAALGRQALHAAVLGFAHPATGAVLRFESPLPPDMAALVEALRAYRA